jgi:hypothetical protein
MTRSEIAVIARRILTREIDPIDGCRAIVRRQGVLSSEERGDPDFRVLVAIESETDHIPAQDSRDRWSAMALREKDRQRAEYLARNELALRDACKALVEKLV